MSLVNTLMQPLRTKYAATLDKNEARGSRYGAYDFFRKDSSGMDRIFTSEDVQRIKRSFGNSVVIPVLDAKNVTIGNVRSCTVADDENTSNLVTLSFVTYAFGFTMHPASHYNNDVAYQQDFDRKLVSYLNKLAATLDSACITQLETNKNALWTDLTDYYAVVADALQVPLASHAAYYNDLQAIMDTADFYGDIEIISSTTGSPIVRYLMNQGAGNDENNAFAMTPYNWGWSNRIANGVGVKSTQYAVQSGTVAMETRLDPDAIAKSKIGQIAQWDAVKVPIPGSNYELEMASFYREDCGDASGLHAGTSGLTATKKQSFQWSVDVVYATAYNSNPAARYNPIIKAELLTA